MSEKTSKKSAKRSSWARRFVALGRSEKGLPSGLTYLRALGGFGIALAVTLLLSDLTFQQVPEYRTGTIADRTIEASQDFTVEDVAATSAKKAEIAATTPVVFDFDYTVNNWLETDFRRAFSAAREFVQQERETRRIPADRSLPRSVFEELKKTLEERFPQLNQGKVLQLFLRRGFSSEMEDALVELLQEALRYPGVVGNRDQLLSFQDRGIVLRNTLTGEESSDWISVRDLEQAKSILRQNEYELTLFDAEERRELIGFLEGLIRPNVEYNEEVTLERLNLVLAEVDPVLIQVKKGKTLVRSGDEVTERQAAQLMKLRSLSQPGVLGSQIVGIFLIVAFFFLALWQFFVVRSRGESTGKSSRYLLLASVLLFSLGATRLFFWLADIVAGSINLPVLQDPVHFYFFAPLALGAILTTLLGGLNLALLFSIIFTVFVGLLTGEMSLLVYTLTGSIASVYALENYRERTAIIRAGLSIGAVAVLIAFALQLYSSQANFSWIVFFVRSLGGVVSGLTAATLTSVALPLFESLFGVTTDIRLLELSNLNSPILRRLAVEAPGTYHHSIIVGTLAEAGAEAISANSLLARVGAYYHDIGKLKHPEYYVENQIYIPNKHETLSPRMSSLILASHVKDGIAIAEEIGLAPKVRDLIPEHHGTRLMTFFYQKAKDTADRKSGDINEEDFRYPGPKPHSKEAAILMLADQVEAAARTLQDPSPGQVRGLIERLVQSTIQDGQLDECNITMKELLEVAKAFERVLTGMYHHRIEYPGFEFKPQVERPRTADQRIQ